MSRPGFRSFSTPQLVLTVWGAFLLATLLFISLQFSLLQMVIPLVPLLAVAIAVTVANHQNHRDASRG